MAKKTAKKKKPVLQWNWIADKSGEDVRYHTLDRDSAKNEIIYSVVPGYSDYKHGDVKTAECDLEMASMSQFRAWITAKRREFKRKLIELDRWEQLAARNGCKFFLGCETQEDIDGEDDDGEDDED